MTPDTTYSIRLTVTRRPSTPGSPPNAERQNAWLMTAAALETWSSAGSITRPSCGTAPRTAKYEPDTSIASARICSPATTTVVDVRRQAACPRYGRRVLAYRVERDIRRRRHPRPARGVARDLEGEREQAVGTNDVTSGRQDRAVDEPEDREVGARRHGEQEHRGERRDRRRQEGADGVDQVGAEAFKHEVCDSRLAFSGQSTRVPKTLRKPGVGSTHRATSCSSCRAVGPVPAVNRQRFRRSGPTTQS